jgi:hypothetical protein
LITYKPDIVGDFRRSSDRGTLAAKTRRTSDVREKYLSKKLFQRKNGIIKSLSRPGNSGSFRKKTKP